MPGQATVTIKETQWSVSIASTYAELSKGLGGVASIPAATGMLFVLPAEQTVSVTTQSMLFNLDIIFISSDLKVVDVARDIAPGYVMTESTPVRYFLEVNAGEAAAVEVGDAVTIEQLATIQDNITPVIAFAIPLVALGFVCSLAGGMARALVGSSSSPKLLTSSSPSPGQAEKELGALARAPYISETKRIGDKVIKKYSVAGTDLIVYEVYEPSALMGPHGTVTSIEGKWYGRVGTRRPPPELEALPAGSEERFRAVGKWYEGQYEEAYKLITEAFPEAQGGRRSMGEITLHWIPSGQKITPTKEGKCRYCRNSTATLECLWKEEPKTCTHYLPIKESEKPSYLKVNQESDFSSSYGLWDSYIDYGAAVREANRLRKVGWKARITEAETPQGKRFRVWVFPARRKIEGHLPYPEEETPSYLKEPIKERAGLCYLLAWRHITEQGEGILIHGEVWSEKLGRMINHAWVETETGYIYEPESDSYYPKDWLYKTYKIKELNTYTPDQARIMALRTGTYGPWTEEERRAFLKPEHHSMWLTLEQRKELEKKYGTVAVRWAEEATRPGDIEAAERAAAYYYGKIKEYFALGHGSPELTKEQIMKLRELLGLPAEVPPREKGYID